jgi:hypothetical protein
MNKIKTKKLSLSNLFLWFIEIFTKKYYKTHTISSMVFYVIIIMIFYSIIIDLIPNFNLLNLLLFILKLLLVLYIFAVIKFIAEKLNLEEKLKR